MVRMAACTAGIVLSATLTPSYNAAIVWSMEAIEIPPSMIYILTAEECAAKAREAIERLNGCLDPEMRRDLKAEARGWQRLASVRAD
jgi:hypothetical protein